MEKVLGGWFREQDLEVSVCIPGRECTSNESVNEKVNCQKGGSLEGTSEKYIHAYLSQQR